MGIIMPGSPSIKSKKNEKLSQDEPPPKKQLNTRYPLYKNGFPTSIGYVTEK